MRRFPQADDRARNNDELIPCDPGSRVKVRRSAPHKPARRQLFPQIRSRSFANERPGRSRGSSPDRNPAWEFQPASFLPQINTDQTRMMQFEIFVSLSVFICVHLWLTKVD